MPDPLTGELVHAPPDQSDARRGLVLDRHPRTLNQAPALNAVLGAGGRKIDVVLCFTAPVGVLKLRLAVRLAVEGRTDDAPEIAERRLETYRRQSQHVVDHYTEQGNLIEIDGGQSIPKVSAAIDTALGHATDAHPSEWEQALRVIPAGATARHELPSAPSEIGEGARRRHGGEAGITVAISPFPRNAGELGERDRQMDSCELRKVSSPQLGTGEGR